MLPDWPKAKRSIAAYYRRQMRLSVRNRSLMGQINTTIIHEGSNFEMSRYDDEKEIQNFTTAEGTFTVSHKEIMNMRLPDFIKKLEEPIESISSSISKNIFQTIDSVTEKTGNVIDGKGRPLTAELMIEALEKIQISFVNGEVRWPTFVIHPKQEERIKNEITRLTTEPVLKRRMDELIRKKREDYYAREANRILVG